VQVLVTDDFASASPYINVRFFGVGIRHFVELLVIVNVATTAPLLVLPLEDIVQSIFRGADGGDNTAVPEAGSLSYFRPILTHCFELSAHSLLLFQRGYSFCNNTRPCHSFSS
jgi:hypothetical protein